MTVPLVALLGAGASRAAGNWDQGSPVPPLTLDLFDEGSYRSILDHYELAHQAGRYVIGLLQAPEPPAFEQLLRGLRESHHAHHRHMSLAVPFYLQELLWAVSEAQYRSADVYDRFIERLLTLPFVVFMTLNYDVLLDRRLNAHHLLSGINDYITTDPDKNWALLKLHGSVNWYRELATSVDACFPAKTLDFQSTTVGVVAPNAGLDIIRNSPTTTTSRYPALALPEGPDDEIVLPAEHLNFWRRLAASVHEIDLLVAGYSGYDQEVLRLIAQSMGQNQTRIRRVTVVNTDRDNAAQVRVRLHEAGIKGVWEDIRSEDFSGWARGDGLDHLVDDYGKGPDYDDQ
jgi:hypothetical protein